MIYDKHDRETEADREIIEETTPDADISLEEEESRSSDKIKKLQTKLKESEAARTTLHEDLQRVKADFLNAKKRLEDQKQRDIERVTMDHFEALLPLCDSFDAAINDPHWESADETWRKGVEGIYGQLQNLLKASGVSVIDPLDAPFNPYEHDALRGEGEIVTEVYQKGYKLQNAVIRPAKVSVEAKSD